MPTLNPGPGVEITQEKTIAAASLAAADTHDEYMTHLVKVEFADVKIKGDMTKDAIMKVTAIAGNKVTLGARQISDNGAIANIKTGVALPVQIIARGY